MKLRCRECIRPVDQHDDWCDSEYERRIREEAWQEGYTYGVQDERTAYLMGGEYSANRVNPYRDDPQSSYGQRMYIETDEG